MVAPRSLPFLGVMSHGMRDLDIYAALLEVPVARWRPWSRVVPGALLAWGRKPSAQRVERTARRLGCPVIRLEDGFLRSYGTGNRYPPLSLVVDTVGIYYDSTRPSTLEDLLNSDEDVLAGIVGDVEHARRRILTLRLIKYNHAPDWRGELDLTRRNVLVVDQTFGDLSVNLGGADADTFGAMLAAARAEHPDAIIHVKTHPEVSSGRKRGYLTQVTPDANTRVWREAINPLSLIEHMDHVYVVTSTLGFEALLADKPVTCFGLPWYAGWGATDDRQVCSRRTRRRSIPELFAAAYFRYARYLDPLSHTRGTLFDVLDWLERQRTMAARWPDRTICVGFNHLRRQVVRPMLTSALGQQPLFARDAQAVARLDPQPGDRLIVWGGEPAPAVRSLARRTGAGIVRVEDGFVRSVGLGSDLVPPLSLVFDTRGIYFDAGSVSDLEHVLNTHEFVADELARARAVRETIVAHGITKYNLDVPQTARWHHDGAQVVLVPGQVEDDASIRLGCGEVNGNLTLLRAARQAHPDAFLVYKPHPDVSSGNRAGRLAHRAARAYADHIETEVSVLACIAASDVVHTMTSLAGFDALLRGKRVVVYGQPFYAGWGLTEDVMSNGVALARRRRRLSLDELVAGVLLRYPIYWDPRLCGYTTCEAVLRHIVATRDSLQARGALTRLRDGYLRRQLRKARHWLHAWWQ
jgi:capsular polysaccharide export protein